MQIWKKLAWIALSILSVTAKAGMGGMVNFVAADRPSAIYTLYPVDSEKPERTLLDAWLNTHPFALEPVSSKPVLLAHAILVKGVPEKEAVLTDAPEEILLTFNEGVGTRFLALAVVDASGKRVDKHDARLEFTDHSNLKASVEKLLPGRYLVRYRVLSADGHVVSGKYFFNVKANKK